MNLEMSVSMTHLACEWGKALKAVMTHYHSGRKSDTTNMHVKRGRAVL